VPTKEKDKEGKGPQEHRAPTGRITRRTIYQTLQFPSIKMIYNHPSCDKDLKEKIKSGYFNTDPDILKRFD